MPLSFRYASVYAISGCVFLLILGFSSYFLLDDQLLSLGLSVAVAVVAYLVISAIFTTFIPTPLTKQDELTVEKMIGEKSSDYFANAIFPTLFTDANGFVLWCNDVARSVFEEPIDIHSTLSKILGPVYGNPVDLSGRVTRINDKEYRLQSTAIKDESATIYVVTLTDYSEEHELALKYDNEWNAVGYLVLDNVEDAIRFVHVNSIEATAAIDETLKAWADEMGAFLKSYDHEKYILLMDRKHLNECIKDRFSLLETIRNNRIGDDVSLTVSIGISDLGDTLAEREKNAAEALDLAISRGGDQAVVKTKDGIVYYGGRTQSVYKKTNVRSRTVTGQLCSLISRSDNVVIMGHRYGDFDSIGASVGLARLAMMCGAKVNIALDPRDDNLAGCVALLKEWEDYQQVFVDSAEAFDLMGPETLLIITDVNSLPRTQFADVAQQAKKIALVDHHRKGEETVPNLLLCYIEPSASSSCELVAEMLECVTPANNLLKIESNLLLAGILLDSKQFTRNTGTRTFASAQYLRSAGANPSDVYDLFRSSVEDLSKEAKFMTSITVYHDNIALSSCDGNTDESYRIIASKVADKLLTLKGIDAAFSLVRIGDHIHISGRSNGSVNVQLILEELNGGGRFEVAGAQVVSESALAVMETLKNAIDHYFENQ